MPTHELSNDWAGPPLAVVERNHRANLAKLGQLARDAATKAHEATDDRNRAYWRGQRDAYARSIRVLEGKG